MSEGNEIKESYVKMYNLGFDSALDLCELTIRFDFTKEEALQKIEGWRKTKEN